MVRPHILSTLVVVLVAFVKVSARGCVNESYVVVWHFMPEFFNHPVVCFLSTLFLIMVCWHKVLLVMGLYVCVVQVAKLLVPSFKTSSSETLMTFVQS